VSAGALALVTAIFLLGGFVKGVTGLGLAAVSLALLTVSFGLKPALALMLVPALVTNVWQAAVGGAFWRLSRRFWAMLATVAVGAWFGVGILARSESWWLSALLGLLLAGYAATGLFGFRPPRLDRSEPWLSPLVGAVSGVLTGLTGSFLMPGVIYLPALGLQREALIQAMGILFTVSTVALAAALGDNRLISAEQGLTSLYGVLPALAGMGIGVWVRRRLSEALFRRVFFLSLLALGFYIVWRALG
jgi:hypothetical protein